MYWRNSLKMFRYIDRNKKNTIVLIPGWATDYRVFDALNLEFNYLIPDVFDPYNFEDNLLAALDERGLKKISLFGWSLGGFVAAEFASKHPQSVDELILVSIRRKYKEEELTEIRGHLENNKKGYLYKFYQMCFCEGENKGILFRKYCWEMNLDYLLKTLEYLRDAEIRPESLHDTKRIKIIHGRNDNIAPINEAIGIKDRLKNAKFITMEDTGHVPFLKEEFKAYI